MISCCAYPCNICRDKHISLLIPCSLPLQNSDTCSACYCFSSLVKISKIFGRDCEGTDRWRDEYSHLPVLYGWNINLASLRRQAEKKKMKLFSYSWNSNHGNSSVTAVNKVFFGLIKIIRFVVSINLEAMQNARLLLLLSNGIWAKICLQWLINKPDSAINPSISLIKWKGNIH